MDCLGVISVIHRHLATPELVCPPKIFQNFSIEGEWMFHLGEFFEWFLRTISMNKFYE